MTPVPGPLTTPWGQQEGGGVVFIRREIRVSAPPSEQLDYLLKLLPKLETSDIIIGGDFNIDSSRPRKENIRKSKRLSTKYNLTQYIKNPALWAVRQ